MHTLSVGEAVLHFLYDTGTGGEKEVILFGALCKAVMLLICWSLS